MKVLILLFLACALLLMSQASDAEEENSTNENTFANPTVLKSTTSCPVGWHEFKGRCFRYVPTQKTWADAEKTCLSMGANLASANGFDDYHNIQSLINTATTGFPEAWLGGSNAQQDDVWLWSDGTSFQFTHWCFGEPNNNHGNQHCLQMNYGDNKCGDDMWCNKVRPFVCAKKI